MLPQKITLDVVIDRQTDEIIVLEMNGSDSGYKGLVELGQSPVNNIAQLLARTFEGKIVVASEKRLNHFDPGLFEMLQEQEVEIWPMEGQWLSALKDYVSVLLFPPDPTFDDFSPYHLKSINHPALELVAGDKLLQSIIFSACENLSTPRYVLADGEGGIEFLREYLNAHGPLYRKPRRTNQGIGISYISSSSTDCELLNALGTTEIGNQQRIDSVQHIIERTKYFKRVVNLALSTTKREPQEIYDIFAGVCIPYFQHAVDTAPIDTDFGPRHARARLLWFGEYQGGYWAYSSKQADCPAKGEIIHYSGPDCARLFTTEEANRFQKYANNTFPQIIAAITSTQLSAHEEAKVRVLDPFFK